MPLLLKSSSLYQALTAQDSDLAGSLSRCWEEAEKLLRHAAATNPSLTSHGPDHALEVVGILDQAIEPICDSLKLSPDEAYVLLAATLLHDIGMVGAVETTEEYRERIRTEHHIRTHQYICSNRQALSLRREFVEVIADVAAAHRQLDIERDIDDRPIGYSSQTAPRAKLCAALLRLADECHITADRVPQDYDALQLSSSSLEHFRSHLSVTGRAFDARAGTITFTVVVETFDMERVLRERQIKFEQGLHILQPLLRKYGVPYESAVWCEARRALICYKLMLAILGKGRRTAYDLEDELEEDPSRLGQFLRTFGSCSPFHKVPERGGDAYDLLDDESVFNELGAIFLQRPQRRQDALTFIRSDFCQKFLSDGALERLVGDSLSSSAERPLAFRILRVSPSALSYVLQNMGKLPKRHIAGAGGLLHSLIGELQNDFQVCPELLLEPGLLDEAFDDGKRDEETWKRWRIFQIYEYHKGFEESDVLGQWAVLNEWDRRADPCLVNAPGEEMRFTMTCPEDRFEHPMLLLAAALRLGLEFNMEIPDKASLSVEVEGRPDLSRDDMRVMSYRRSPDPHDIRGCLPCRLRKEGAGKYVIEAPWADPPTVGQWNAPIRLKFRVRLPQRQEGSVEQKAKLDYSFSLNSDLLDCEQAADILEAAGDPEAQFFITRFAGKAGDLQHLPLSSGGFLMDLGKRERSIIHKLARIQEFLGLRIPYPAFGMPSDVEELLLASKIVSAEEASDVWSEVLSVIDQQGKPTVSPVIAEMLLGERVHDRELLERYLGVHRPRMGFPVAETACEDPQELLESALDNPNARASVAVAVRLSPQATIQFLKENRLRAGGEEKVHPGMLHSVQAKSAAQYRTRAELIWEPAVDHTWCNLTPFRCVLHPIAAYHRWLIESRYFAEEKGDFERAYIAAREAFRCEPEKHEVRVSFGWRAFQVGRLEEALNVQKPVATIGSGRIVFTACINMGLCSLRKAAVDESKREEHVRLAARKYQDAETVLSGLHDDQALLAVGDAIKDLQEFRGRLDPQAEEYLLRFRKVRSDIVSGCRETGR